MKRMDWISGAVFVNTDMTMLKARGLIIWQSDYMVCLRQLEQHTEAEMDSSSGVPFSQLVGNILDLHKG